MSSESTGIGLEHQLSLTNAEDSYIHTGTSGVWDCVSVTQPQNSYSARTHEHTHRHTYILTIVLLSHLGLDAEERGILSGTQGVPS